MHATYNQTLGKFSFIAQAVLPERMQCRYLQQQQIQAVIETNSFGGSLSGNHHKGTWSHQERTKRINVLELIAVRLAILTFTRGKSVTTIHLQIDNMTALSYLVKVGGTRSQELL